jgi:hypothetical protein
MKKPALTIVILTIIQGAAYAGSVRIIGAGVDSCGAWIEDRSHRPSVASEQDVQWVLGFLSGVAVVNGTDLNPLNGVDAYGVMGWMDNFCRENPLLPISTAATRFYKEHPK